MALPKLTLTPPNLNSVLPGVSLPGAQQTPQGGFADLVKNMVSSAVDANTQAQNLTMAAASGQDVPLNDIVQAVNKAELTLQTLITVRDKAIDAYQQIQQLPI